MAEQPDARAWRRRAHPLALWVWANLINRIDVWGRYLPPDSRPVKTRADGTNYVLKSVTAPAVVLRGQRFLNVGRLVGHFAAWNQGNLIGLHTSSVESLCRWMLIEVDRHGDDDDGAANWSAILFWHNVLVGLGMTPLLSESNGAGGYHLRVVFDTPLPSRRVYRFLLSLVSDWKQHGLSTVPEVFPKQPEIPADKYGNWVRLPGRHHSRDHWSRFWTGGAWVAGDAAVDLILAHRPDPASLLPEIPEPAQEAQSSSCVKRTVRTGGMSEREVAVKCLDALNNSGNGMHYDDWLRIGAALHSVDTSPSMLAEWERFSRQSSKYCDGECSYKWDSFDVKRERRATLGTLVKFARDAGHDPFPRRRERQARKSAGPATIVLPSPIIVATSLPDPPVQVADLPDPPIGTAGGLA